jgi:hypothetical protein
VTVSLPFAGIVGEANVLLAHAERQ